MARLAGVLDGLEALRRLVDAVRQDLAARDVEAGTALGQITARIVPGPVR